MSNSVMFLSKNNRLSFSRMLFYHDFCLFTRHRLYHQNGGGGFGQTELNWRGGQNQTMQRYSRYKNKITKLCKQSLAIRNFLIQQKNEKKRVKRRSSTN